MGRTFSWQYRRFFGFHWGIPFSDSPSKARDPYINPKTLARISRSLVHRLESGCSQNEIAEYPLEMVIDALLKTTRKAKLHMALRPTISVEEQDIALHAYNSLKGALSLPEIFFVSNSKNHRVLEDILSDPNTPEEILARYANDTVVRISETFSVNVGASVAKNPYIIALTDTAEKVTDPKSLNELSQKPFPCVRAEVASNTYCPTPTLESLAKDSQWIVKLAAAKNPKTPPFAVAGVLSEIRQDTYKVQTGTETVYECVAACHDGERWEYVDYPVFSTKYGYVSKSLETAREILGYHLEQIEQINEHLKALNRHLSDALFPAKY